MILIDAHVHIYDCFDLQNFLDSAFANFRAESTRCGQNDSFTAALLLTETSEDNWFQRLTSFAGLHDSDITRPAGKWSFEGTRENCSLLSRPGNSQELFLIAGRQVVTEEGLEVLALFTAETFKDGTSVQELIKAIKAQGGIPVIPWALGKWMGRRGAIVRDILRTKDNSSLFLGDNGGRPAFLPPPSHFKLAKRKAVRVLPGSDPLPFHSESHRAGSFGLSIRGTINPKNPAADLKRLLLDPEVQFCPYGNLENPCRFFHNQLKAWITKQRQKQ